MSLILRDEWIEIISDYFIQNQGKSCQKEEISRYTSISQSMIEACIFYLIEEKQWDIIIEDDYSYCLRSTINHLKINQIRQYMHSYLQPTIECFDCIESTNDIMKDRALQNAPDGSLLLAEEQTNGHGRLQRSWISPKYQNIYATFLWRRAFKMSDIVRMSMIVAVAVCRALRTEYNCDAKIKWPNDIFIHSKKCGGILCEVQINQNTVEFILVGIGLNVNMEKMPEEIEQCATSIYLETGKKEDRNRMIAIIYNLFQELLDDYQTTADFEPIWKEYQSMSLVLQQKVRIIEGSKSYQGIVENIDENGVLLLQMSNGEKKQFLSGDVSLRI